jgi:hypothetical protein
MTLTNVVDRILAALADWLSAKLCERVGSHDYRQETAFVPIEGGRMKVGWGPARCRWCPAERGA